MADDNQLNPPSDVEKDAPPTDKPPGDPDPNAGKAAPLGEQEPLETDKEALQWALFAHLGGLLLGFLGPLIVWLVKKDDHPFVDDQGKEALNFQLTLLIVWLAASVIATITCGFGAFLYVVPIVLSIVFSLIGGLEANKGKRYRYPMTIRMVQ